MFTQFAGSRNKIVNSILPVLSTLLVIGTGFIMLKDRLGSWWPEQSHLRHWDAGWYKSIVDNGYVFDANAANNTAFFPLFPYVWRWLGVDEFGIAVFNSLIFVIACAALFQLFPSKLKLRLAFLALSITVFYVAPFSESLFFIFSLVVLRGLDLGRPSFVVLGIIGAGLTRSVCTIFFPAFLLMAAFNFWETRRFRDSLPYLTYSIVSLATLLGVFLIHWYQTGFFWAFSYSQQFWGSRFGLPDTPFSTWAPEDNGYYDQLAVYVCLACIMYLTFLLVKTVIRKQPRSVDDPVLFSLLYFAGIAVLMLFTRRGGFNSMNRYVFCVPYMYLLIRYIDFIEIKRSMVITLLVVGIAYYNICWHMGTSLEREAVAMGLLSLSFLLPISIRKNSSWANACFLLIWTGLIIVQANLWYRYVTGIWVG